MPDINTAARSVIQDWNCGKIPYYTLPPKQEIDQGCHVSSEIMTGFAQEFTLEGFNNNVQSDFPMQIEDETTLEMAIDEPIKPLLDKIEIDEKPQIELRLHKKRDEITENVENSVESTILVNQQHSRSMKKTSKKMKKDARRAYRYETGE